MAARSGGVLSFARTYTRQGRVGIDKVGYTSRLQGWFEIGVICVLVGLVSIRITTVIRGLC